jgi:flagellar hook protein FlgE
MSLFNAMRTSISGMAAQSNKLGTVADNIANSATTGYKAASTEFASLVEQNSGGFSFSSTVGSYTSGSVQTHVRNGIWQQGNLQQTTSVTDLAIQGNGFFVVSDASGSSFLTRAGAFVPDANGKLVNSAGFYLMGYDLRNGTPNAVANSFSGLTPVQISQAQFQANPSTTGVIAANLPSNGAIVPAANLPSANAATATYTAKSSLVSYDDLGNPVTLDVYTTKTNANNWEVAVYNQADATPGTGFPYANPPLSTQTLQFDPTSGKLLAGGPTNIAVNVPNGKTLTIDLSSVTQLATVYTVFNASVNGNAPSSIDHIEIGKDGTLTTVYADGTRVNSYSIPLANTPSPDNLAALPGNVYGITTESGNVVVGSANAGGLGQIASSSLEESTVDLAGELTSMIEAQHAYTANSKVFQTGSDLLDVLINLKR